LGDAPATVVSIENGSDKGGRITANRNGSYTYSPRNNFSGQDSFDYTIRDSDGDTSTAQVSVSVLPGRSPLPTPSPRPQPGKTINLRATSNYLDGSTRTQRWGSDVRISAEGFGGEAARVSYYSTKSDKGFGVISRKDRAKQLDFYQAKGSEKLVLEFDELIGDMTLSVGMVGVNEDKPGNDETGKWTALNARGQVVGRGLIGPDESALGAYRKIPSTYGQYPIEIDTRSPFAELVIEATGFSHGQRSPTRQSYGENNSDFVVTDISFDPIPGTQGGF